MLRVGLTGGIAAGKSTVARRLAELGAVVIDADAIARDVVAPGTDGYDAVVATFGSTVVADDGSLDRARLGAIVFADPERRAALNAIVHPRVYARRQELVDAAPADAIVVEDVPLIVENDLGAGYHLVVVVDAAQRERIRRLMADRGMTESDARARIAAQASDDERRAAADVWLDNTTDPAALQARVDAIWSRRLVPFEENLRRGRPARSAPLTRPDPVEPDPTWPAQARRVIARLARIAGDRALDIRHVGPTAAADSAAPDVLDIDVTVADPAAVDALVAEAAGAGLVALPESAAGESSARYLVEADPGRPVHVRVIPADR